jgi:TonB-dependent starch-binding outer membrane protein SusC
MKILHLRNCLPKLKAVCAKNFLVMKMTSFLLLMAFLQSHAEGNAQDVTLSASNVPLEYVFKQINKQTGIEFVYDIRMLKKGHKVNLSVKNEAFENVLKVCFNAQPFSFVIEGNTVVVKEKEAIQKKDFPLAQIILSEVKGIVNDEKGKPLAGVSVVNKSSGKGTSTQENGSFTIDAKKGDILEFSYVGYRKQTYTIQSEDNLVDISLSVEINDNATVVVIGYGEQKKRDISSAIGIVETKDLKDRPIVSAADAIAGKTQGVQVLQPSGKPGSDFTVLVRGISSLTGNTQPLYVIDGVITYDTKSIDPANIESISILKDAAAAGIYGAAGSTNGVVLIKTKKGSKGPARIEANFYTGTQEITRKLSVLSNQDLAILLDEETKNANGGTFSIPADLLKNNNNWQDLVYRKAPMTGVNVSTSGGTEKGTYYLGLGYLNQDGIAQTSFYKRYSLNLGLQQSINDWLSIGADLNYNRSNSGDLFDNQRARFGGFVLGALNAPLYAPLQNADGTYGFLPYSNGVPNPFANVYGTKTTSINNALLGNTHLQIKLPFSLTFRTQLGVALNNVFTTGFSDPKITVDAANAGGRGSYSSSEVLRYLWDNTLTFNKRIGKNAVNIVLGTNYTDQNGNYSFQSGNNFANGVTTLNGASSITASQTSADAWTSLSYFSRLTYSYNDKYLATATFRRDGSSRFGSNNRWANFPAFSLGWKVSSEKFMENVNIISDLKIRGSWGKTGNTPIDYYPSYNTLNVGYNYAYNGMDLSNGVNISGQAGNPDLKWETTTQSNIGFDVSFLKGKINLTADYYVKKTEDLIFRLNLPLSTGQSTKVINLANGYIQNSGFEFGIAAKVINAKGFTWNSRFNMSFNKNIVKGLAGDQIIYSGEIQNSGFVSVTKSGLPLGAFWGYQSDGVDPQTGNMKFNDLDKNGKIDANDRTYIGNPLPKAYYGFSNDFSYQNFSVNLLIDGVYGNKVYNATRMEMSRMDDYTNQSTDVLRRWKKPGDVTDVPKAVLGDPAPVAAENKYVPNASISSRFIDNGSFLRFRQITLGYNFNEEMCKKIALSNLRLFATLQNVLMITKYKGYNPDLNSGGTSAINQGMDYGTFPKAKTYTIGINVQL